MIWLHADQFWGDVSTSAARIGVLTRPRPRADISLHCVGAIVDDLIGFPPSDGVTPIPKRNLIAPKSSIVGEISFLIMQLLALREFTGGATMTAKCE